MLDSGKSKNFKWKIITCTTRNCVMRNYMRPRYWHILLWKHRRLCRDSEWREIATHAQYILKTCCYSSAQSLRAVVSSRWSNLAHSQWNHGCAAGNARRVAAVYCYGDSHLFHATVYCYGDSHLLHATVYCYGDSHLLHATVYCYGDSHLLHAPLCIVMVTVTYSTPLCIVMVTVTCSMPLCIVMVTVTYSTPLWLLCIVMVTVACSTPLLLPPSPDTLLLHFPWKFSASLNLFPALWK